MNDLLPVSPSGAMRCALRQARDRLIAPYCLLDGIAMSPTIFRDDGFEPAIEVAQNYGLNDRQVRAAEALIRKHEDDIRTAWRKHFGR